MGPCVGTPLRVETGVTLLQRLRSSLGSPPRCAAFTSQVDAVLRLFSARSFQLQRVLGERGCLFDQRRFDRSMGLPIALPFRPRKRYRRRALLLTCTPPARRNGCYAQRSALALCETAFYLLVNSAGITTSKRVGPFLLDKRRAGPFDKTKPTSCQPSASLGSANRPAVLEQREPDRRKRRRPRLRSSQTDETRRRGHAISQGCVAAQRLDTTLPCESFQEDERHPEWIGGGRIELTGKDLKGLQWRIWPDQCLGG